MASNFPGKFLILLVIWEQKNREGVVDIKTFYNEIFVMAVKPLLDEVKHGKASDRAHVEKANNADSVCLLFQLASLHINLFIGDPLKTKFRETFH